MQSIIKVINSNIFKFTTYLLFFTISPAAFANQVAHLDPSFGNNSGHNKLGIIDKNQFISIKRYGGSTSYSGSTIQQKDGKIVFVSVKDIGHSSSITLTRRNQDNSIDESFGDKGRVLTTMLSQKVHVFQLIEQSDGKLVISGNIEKDWIIKDAILIRYNTDGSLDKSFGVSGIAHAGIPYEKQNSLTPPLAQLHDNKLLISVHIDDGIALIRFNVDGSIDKTFGKDGFQRLLQLDLGALPTRIFIQDDGQILVVGKYDYFFDRRIITVKMNANGTLDKSYGENGISQFKIPPFSESPSEYILEMNITQLQDKRLVILGDWFSGHADYIGEGLFLLALDVNGSLDKSFADKGIYVASNDNQPTAQGLIQLRSGQILISGNSPRKSEYNEQFMLFHSNGKLDKISPLTFDLPHFPGFLGGVASLFEDSDNYILVAGNLKVGLDGVLIEASKTFLKIRTPSSVNSITIQEDGKLLVSGSTLNDFTSHQDPVLVRYLTDGTIDPNFSRKGLTEFRYPSSHTTPEINRLDNAIELDDGKIFIVGLDDDSSLVAMRLLSDGDLDPTFGVDGYFQYDIYHVGKSAEQPNILSSAINLVDDSIVILSAKLNHDRNISIDNDFSLLLKLTPEGLLDANFGDNGAVLTKQPHSERPYFTYKPVKVIAQKDNKLLALGNLKGGVESKIVLHRYESDGKIDSSFANGGSINLAFALQTKANSIIQQNDGKLVIVGSVDDSHRNSELTQGSDYVIFRLNTDGSLDNSFDSDGIASYSFSHNDKAISVVQQKDGKILLLGTGENNGTVNTLIRLNIDGSLDTSFSSSGISFLPADVSSELSIHNLVTKDDAFFIAGSTISDFILAKILLSPEEKLTDANKTITLDILEDTNETALLLHAPSFSKGHQFIWLGRTPEIGQATLSSNEEVTSIRYAPHLGVSGKDKFSIKFYDGENDVAQEVTFNVNIEPVNDAPIAYSFISGETKVAGTLTLTGNLYEEEGYDTYRDGTGFSYSWFRDGIKISTEKNYTVSNDDIGTILSASFHYTDHLGTNETVSASLAEVIAGNPNNKNESSGDDSSESSGGGITIYMLFILFCTLLSKLKVASSRGRTKEYTHKSYSYSKINIHSK